MVGGWGYTTSYQSIRTKCRVVVFAVNYAGVRASFRRITRGYRIDVTRNLFNKKKKKNRFCVENDKNGLAPARGICVHLTADDENRVSLLSVTRSFHYVFRPYFSERAFPARGSFTRLPGPFTVYPVVIFTKGDIQSFDPFFHACSVCCRRRVFVCSINCK